jgi:hypothetical protein
MAAIFSKKTALELFCCFRQAERSVHHAAAGPKQWARFLAYYDEPKQARSAALLEILKAAGAVPGNVPDRLSFEPNSFLYVLRSAAAILVNRLRLSWSFSVSEISFFSATLGRLLALLHCSDKPDGERLIDLRLDCCECHAIIRRKLIGIPELRLATSIEHFDQSEYVRHFTFEDIGIASTKPRETHAERG